jgi:predicted nucleotidyltransferase
LLPGGDLASSPWSFAEKVALTLHCPNLQAMMVTGMPELGMIMPNMGMKRPGRSEPPRAPRGVGLADALFTGTQQRVLALLFGQPARSYYATELIGLAGVGSGAVQRELARLTRSGLITVRPIGNQKHYQANPDSLLFAELCSIAQKTVGLAEPLREALRPLAAQIRAAFVYGSVAKRQDTVVSDIDLMVVSDTLSYGDLFGVLEVASSRLGRSVNPTILSGKELAKRMKSGTAFVKRMLSQPKIWLIGGEDDLV